MQAAAALETELADVVDHGPGHHLGSNGIDHEALSFIKPIARTIDRTSGVLERWKLLLHLLRDPPLDVEGAVYRDADILIALRNELVHYRSNWDGLTKPKSLVTRLRAKKFENDAFSLPSTNDFPLRILTAKCALWAADTAAHFLDSVYENLETYSVLEGHRRPGAALREAMPARLPKAKKR
jgi:hypothetical protein